MILLTVSLVLLLGNPSSFTVFSSLSAQTILAMSGVSSSASITAFAPSTLFRKMCRLYWESCLSVSLHITDMYFKGLPSILWLLTFIGVMCGQSILYSGISASSSSQYFLSIGVADMQVTLLNFLAVSSRFLIALLRKLYWFNSRCHSSIHRCMFS